MTVVELHALALAKVMAAWDEQLGTAGEGQVRADFEARASDGLAQVFTIVSCSLADAKDAGRAEAWAKAAERCDREAARAKANVEPSRRDGVSGTPPHWWGFAHAMQEHAEWLRREAAR